MTISKMYGTAVTWLLYLELYKRPSLPGEFNDRLHQVKLSSFRSQPHNATYTTPDFDLKQYPGNVLSDEVIYLRVSCKKYPERLRKVVVCDVVNHRTLVLLTNNFDLDAQTIGDIYKSRWQIECFFKMLKQNFKIKTFIGTCENAVKIQVWTALSPY